MLLDYLKTGKENAVSLNYLANVSGMSKRKVREEISRINTSGEEIVCTLANGTGYYIAATIEEAQAYRNYNRSYWMSGIEKDKGIARCMDRKFSGQMSLNDCITEPVTVSL